MVCCTMMFLQWKSVIKYERIKHSLVRCIQEVITAGNSNVNLSFTSPLTVVFMRMHFYYKSYSQTMCDRVTAFAKYLYLFWTLLSGQGKIRSIGLWKCYINLTITILDFIHQDDRQCPELWQLQEKIVCGLSKQKDSLK